MWYRWTQWSSCSKCDEIGKKTKFGHCFVSLNGKVYTFYHRNL